MPDPTHYTYRVTWSAEDGEHVATVAEFPSLSWLAPTPGEALAGLADVVRDVLADLAASGEPVPEPLSERTYSGWCCRSSRSRSGWARSWSARRRCSPR